MTTPTLLGLNAMIGSLVSAASLVTLHVLPTGVPPLRDAVSDYGIGRYRGWYRVAAVAGGIAALAVASTAAVAAAWLPAGALVAGGAARVAIAWFPTDPGDQPVTGTGRVHFWLAFVGFVGIAVGAASFAPSVAATGNGAPLPAWLPWAGWAVAGAAFVMFASTVVPGGRSVFGLLERLYYASFLCWFAIVGLLLLAGG